MRKYLVLLWLLLLPVAAFGADDATPVLGRPHWSLELKGGVFFPEIENFKQFYGDRYTGRYGLALGYKLFRMLEFGIEGNFITKDGTGYAALHGGPAGDVTLQLFPVNAFLLVRGVFKEEQWLVPYIGGGYTYIYYREEVQSQRTVSGHAHGYHARAGLQLLLDGLDRSAANRFYLDAGVYHTYFFAEAQYSRALVNSAAGSVNLGGWSYLGGLLFEF